MASGTDGHIFDNRLWVALVLALTLLVLPVARQQPNDSAAPALQLSAAGETLRLAPVAAAQEVQTPPADRIVPAGITPFFFSPVPLNSADRDLLMTLPGIGPAMADRIIAFRSENGHIRNAADFTRIHGIGPVRLRNLQDLVSFE